MKYYTLKSCEILIDKYLNEWNGEALQIEEGILGLGTLLLHNGDNVKTVLIKEVYLNEWNSTHAVTKYNKMPKKYEKLIN